MKPSSREVNGTHNRILGLLPSKDSQRLRKHMKLVDLPLGKSLYDPYVPLEHVYFPEDGVASLLTQLDNGIETEVATVGREGMVGLLAFSVESVPGRADRKSTRLNSSHQIISYAVFCLKKKKKRVTF